MGTVYLMGLLELLLTGCIDCILRNKYKWRNSLLGVVPLFSILIASIITGDVCLHYYYETLFTKRL